MDLHVTLAGRGDLATRIYRELLDAIVDGRLRAGERLPPTRELGARLEVSRNTVAAAYERLTAEGFLVARVGSGTFVSDQPLRTRPRSAASGGVTPRRLFSALLEKTTTLGAPALAYDFRVGVPDGRLFPIETWRRLLAHELQASAVRDAAYRDPAGHPALRAAIARAAGLSRSVRAAPDDVLVTQGAQQALDLIGRVMLDPGAVVAVEEPGYPPARLLFESLGATIVPVPVDEEGLVVDALPKSARLVYTTPSHQFPLGVPMSLARRAALLDWAERADALIVEDDYDSEFRFSDRPLEPLQSLDRTGRVVYVGTYSKTLLPLLRLGFLVAPAALAPALRLARQLSDWHGHLPTQAALARFLDDGQLGRHVRKATRAYAARHELIVEILERDFADVLQIVPSAAGLHLSAYSLVDCDVPRAVRQGVGIEPLAGYYAVPPGRAGLVLGYGAIPLDRIPEGLRRLRACF
ncbi:MocR-like pyridoxine biosynthesis transcription factor PdxR [Hamadaea tsunoensis]|uniref:MocR-like pyridoxine biosynthesis transcription factor PdxR n=1 Tax=Hamadaea tsunoensis TaxID=53368 RepID=UPI0003F9F584|nr:PLP-dependent aminotransferase family protein [Hamadaea tsunoensis]